MMQICPPNWNMVEETYHSQQLIGTFGESYMQEITNQNINTSDKLLGFTTNTKTSTHGGLTDRNAEDFAQVIHNVTETGLSDMEEQTQNIFINRMQTDLKWMLDSENRGKGKNLSKDQKRDLVVNWVALVHIKYKFDQQTLHRAVNIIDRYISRQSDQIQYQLLAVTAFWMAAKVQERHVKQLRSWAKLGKGFTTQNIIEMEFKILQALNFNIIYPTSEMFLKQFLSNYISIDQKSEVLSLYILQLSLMSRAYTKFKESIVAASAIYLSFKVRSMSIQYLNSQLSGFISENYEQIRICSKMLCRSLQKSKNPQSPIYRKFASKKYLSIASIAVGRRSDTQSASD